jgi:hypothetical protein
MAEVRIMSCREYRRELVELAGGGPLEEADRQRLAAHLEGCRECAELFDRQTALASAVRKLAEETASAVPPEMLETNLLAEFDQAGRRQRRRRLVMRWMAAGAVAASLLAGWFAIGGRGPLPDGRGSARSADREPGPACPPEVVKAEVRPPAAKQHTARRRRVAAPVESAQPFIAIPYTEPLAPYERAAVMRVDLPVAAVIAAGLPVRTADLGASARADVVVGQDGRARAIRVLSISTLN